MPEATGWIKLELKQRKVRNMILADKIMMLRKKSGWSQEEFAEKMNVTRQSVSKWEGAQSVPDLDKILLMSRIFGVSTDYLLKDEVEAAEDAYTEPAEEDYAVRRVSMEEAVAFLKVKTETAGKIALGVLLCILSPVCLLMLLAGCETDQPVITETAAIGIGLVVMLIMVTIAVALFVFCGMQTAPYEYMEQEVLDTEYGVIGMVKERQKAYAQTYIRYNILGICCCILSVVPLFVCLTISDEGFLVMLMVCLMLILVGIGVVFLVTAGIRHESMQKLLQEGEYAKERKTTFSLTRTVSGVYWLLATAIFLGYSFCTNDWGNSWIIWPVAGVLFAAVAVICDALEKRKK